MGPFSSSSCFFQGPEAEFVLCHHVTQHAAVLDPAFSTSGPQPGWDKTAWERLRHGSLAIVFLEFPKGPKGRWKGGKHSFTCLVGFSVAGRIEVPHGVFWANETIN